MRLFLDIGHCDGSTKRGAVDGRTSAVVPEAAAEADHGALLLCAEAIAERPDGEQAAQSVVTMLSEVYAATVEAGTPQQALHEALRAANMGVRAGGERGRAAAVAALVLQGRRWFIGHAGGVRAWRYRDLQIKQLTHDHLAPRALGRAEVTRALGLADGIGAEYHEGELREGDLFLLTSSGVHDVLSGSALLGVLQADVPAQQLAEALVQHALAAHASGYLGACVARVEKLPPATVSVSDAAALPVVGLPETEAEIDGFVIEKLMVKSRRFRLYAAEDLESGEMAALRFPDPGVPGSAQAFLREEWLSRRLESPFLLKPVRLRPGRRTVLYSAMEYRRGQNLAKRIRRKQGLPPSEALPLAEQLLNAVEALHEQGLVHGDIRANTLLYDRTKRCVYMLGLGTERGEAMAEDCGGLRSSTLSYWAPELFQGSPADERSDIYAAGVTVYRMLTAKYPYGRIRTRDDWNQPRPYVPPQRYKEDMPAGLDAVLERACTVDPARRYPSAAEFRAALQGAGLVAPPTPTVAAPVLAPGGRAAPWSWWVAAGLTAALLAYLYFALR